MPQNGDMMRGFKQKKKKQRLKKRAKKVFSWCLAHKYNHEPILDICDIKNKSFD